MNTMYYAGNGGPRTPQGKAIAARNATSHGLFARDIVLPHLGEDPAGYNTLYLELSEQIDPRNLVERHYVEEIAAASWRLRRLHRWQAQVYEDPALTEDQRLDKLDRVLRHETALHRQIDKSVKLLARDVPLLFEGRARKQALADLEQTERACRADKEVEVEVAQRTRENLRCPPLPMDFDRQTLDNTHAPPDPPAETQNCQNEPPTEEALEDAADEAFYAGPFLPPDHVHPDGRPAFICPSDWRYVRELRQEGDDAEADEQQQYSWREYQKLLAEEAEAVTEA